MMDLLWSVINSLAVGLLVWLLHSKIGEYPEPLPKSQTPKREITQALASWALACSVSALMALVITPAFDQLAIDRTRRELVLAPLLAAIYIALPMGMVIKLNGWTVHDFGLTWKSQSRSVAIFAVALGLMTGGVAFVANQAVIGIDLLPWGALLLLLFTNSFIEEFFHRGVIQSLLERAAGQRRALLVGGILFGLTHVVLEFLWSLVPYIALIRVMPEYQRQGAGRALLAFLEDRLRRQGHTVLYSSSQADEAEPQAWHRHMGFVECGFVAGINAGGVGEIFFRKQL